MNDGKKSFLESLRYNGFSARLAVNDIAVRHYIAQYMVEMEI